MTDRCEYAIHWGITEHSRCKLDAKHIRRRATEMHEARGFRRYPTQLITWYPLDRRTYRTSRTDHFAWIEPSH